MKLGDAYSPKGEFASKALVRESEERSGWQLSQQFFMSMEEAQRYAGQREFKWPVEMYDQNLLYIPHPSELY